MGGWSVELNGPRKGGGTGGNTSPRQSGITLDCSDLHQQLHWHRSTRSYGVAGMQHRVLKLSQHCSCNTWIGLGYICYVYMYIGFSFLCYVYMYIGFSFLLPVMKNISTKISFPLKRPTSTSSLWRWLRYEIERFLFHIYSCPFDDILIQKSWSYFRSD